MNNVKIVPLEVGFGAEVSGLDINDDVSPETIAALGGAYCEYHLLVFRDCGRITPAQQVEASSWFGPVLGKGDDENGAWTILRNDEAAGRDELKFHCDISFMAHPFDGISLHPITLPSVATSTTFVSNALAWEALPGEVREEIRPLRARHFYDETQPMDMDWPVLEHWHPVCLLHRTTARPMLFVTEHHVDHIAGVTHQRSAQLLDWLFQALYLTSPRYEHVWHEGDFLVWDNFAIQHARTREARSENGPRALQRVSIGTRGFNEQLQQARDAARAKDKADNGH